MKDELGGQIKEEIVGLRAKRYKYLKNNYYENKKANNTKKVCHKKKT